MKSELSTQLRKEEKIIKRTKGAFVQCGLALARIRDGKLYQAKYETFEGYCHDKWGWGRQRAYQMIEAAEVASELTQNVNHGLQNERQARALASVPKEHREKVLDHASTNGKATAKDIKESAKSILPKVVELDKEGREIPISILPDWQRSIEASSSLVSMVQKVCDTLRNGVKENDKIFREFSNSVVTQAEALRYTIKAHLPAYAVCYHCHGIHPEKCDTCSQRGFVSKYFWDSPGAKQAKALISKRK